ncbi:MAG: N-acetylglucosamine kinase [Psychromonas sp.]|uniref:ROK family protein n=1 Tax=Psychromonas sp. TaxID=1884585 RepID=UPI0039E2B546
MLYGFDVGGTKIAFAVFDQNLNCLFSEQRPTPSDYASFMTLIGALVQQADSQFSCIGSVGIGFPGTLNPQDHSVNCANVAAIKGQQLGADLSALLGRKVVLENDANCFLLSECYGGSADNCATVLAVTLGTGVGGAIFVNGAIQSGFNALAGEIGHYPLPATMLLKYPDLPKLTCGCGRQLCLESYISGTGLSNLYLHYSQNNASQNNAQNHPKTALQGPQIIEKYRAADKTAMQVVDLYLDLLAAGLATAILVLDPDALILGGGLSNLELLPQALEKRLPEHLLKQVSLPKIRRATFGATGGVRGAALLNQCA